MIRLFNRKSSTAYGGRVGVQEGFLEAVSLMIKDIPKGKGGEKKGAGG